MAKARPWRIQWHITADGTVIRQRSKGEAASQQLYGRRPATRPVDVAELDEMQERMAQTSVRWGHATRTLLYATGVVAAATLVGIVGMFLGVDEAIWVLVISVALLVVLGVSVGVVAGRLRRAFDPIRADAGLERDGAWETMAASEARAMLDAPGGTSGRVFHVERA